MECFQVRRHIRCPSEIRISKSKVVLCLILLAIVFGTAHTTKEYDLYQILSVSRTATPKEIKKAYRRAALDTHPDKNPDIPADEAAEQFRKVVHSFQVLSDPESRKRYDRTGRAASAESSSSGGGGRQQGRGNWHDQFQWNFRRRVIKLKDKFQVQQAQQRVLHVVSLEQLETIMLDDNDLLERNLLISFVMAGEMESHVNDEMVFPYPFAAMSPQGIWWEDLLQTVQIRFHRGNDLTRFFGIPDPEEYRASGLPIFMFGRRGQPLQAEQFTRVQTKYRQEMEKWVWKQLEVGVKFINQHWSAVEVYWVHDTAAQLKETIQPGEEATQTSMLSHEWYIRDVRIDSRDDSPGRYKLTRESSMGSWKILNDTSPQEIVIKTLDCMDLSGHCKFWEVQGECRKNPGFMNTECPLTCNLCKVQSHKNETEEEKGGSKDEL